MMSSEVCNGHQELRDMVIELRSDVKHIDERISELIEMVKNNNERIHALETYQNQTIGKFRGVSISATVVSICVSIAVSIVAVVVGGVR